MGEMILPTLSLLPARDQSQDVVQLSASTQLLQLKEVGLLIQPPPSTIQYGRPQLSSQILSIKYKELVSIALTLEMIIKRQSLIKLSKLLDQRVTSTPTGTGLINPRMPLGTQRAEVVSTTPVT